MRRRKAKARFEFVFPCLGKGTRHTIRVFSGGAINFQEHSKMVPLEILALEFQMMGTRGRVFTCQAFAAGMLTQTWEEVIDNPINMGLEHVKAGDFRELAYVAIQKRNERSERKQFMDPFADSLQQRPLSGNVIALKACDILDTCTFRTTSTYQHTVIVRPMLKGKTTFKGTGSAITGATKKNKKNCFIKRHSLITMNLNLVRWARVLKYCGGYVDEFSGGNNLRHFIYEVVKVKSENELYVHVMKQSAGYTVKSRRAVIRRGHDNVWRIHAWPTSWP